jgi:nitronate monooxygenase
MDRARQQVAGYYAELGMEPPATLNGARFSFDDQLAACLESAPAVFSFTFGLIPAPAVAAIRRRGLYLVGTATTVEEATALMELGVDAVVAQGSEAGGHRGTFATSFGAGMVGTMALVPQICDAAQVPVIASGGIMDGRGVAAALALGASAAQLGTAFLTCSEAGVAESYKEAILGAHEDQTRITTAFSGRPARGIANRFLEEMESRQEGILPFPLQNRLTRPLRTECSKRNRAEYLSLWAGQGVRMARRSTAGELVERLRRETDRSAPRAARIEIEYCTQCRWLLRAAWMAQELLTTFQMEAGEVALVPGTGGVFDVLVDGVIVWSRAEQHRFPEMKELKQLVRDRIAPGRDLGHSERG